MTHYLKNPVTGFIPVEIKDKPRRSASLLVCVAICGAFFLGALAESTNVQTARTTGDSLARSDYADLVNSCYDKTRSQDADALYSCIAGGN